MFEALPIPVVFLLSVLFVVTTIGSGFWLSTRIRTISGESLGSVAGATLGLVAFLLAFTFNMAANRFDQRKQLLLDEVNAIGTSYLRAGMLPEPYATETRALIGDYVDLRVDAVQHPDQLQSAIAESMTIQDTLWASVERQLAERTATIADSLFVQSLNDVIDLQQKRITIGVYFRIPATIWIGLYAVAGLAMIVVGFQFGQARRLPALVALLVALAFASVITLITDLDRASEGSVRVDQRTLFDLQKKISASE